VGHAKFFLTFDPDIMTVSESDSDRFVLIKAKSMVEDLLKIAPDPAEYIFDLGIYKGGSIALYHELFQPKRLVGVELSPHRVTALDKFISDYALDETILLHYATRQEDRERLTSIVREDFGDGLLDLVVDDCSHQFEQTRASFNVLFPRVRSGGLYIIEDWGWAHWQGDPWQGGTGPYAKEQDPLSKLILEIVMVSASRRGLVRRVTMDGTTVYVERGSEVVSDAEFDISKSYLSAGRKIFDEPSRSGISLGQQIQNFVRDHAKPRPPS
jgi:hypothetical protein